MAPSRVALSDEEMNQMLSGQTVEAPAPPAAPAPSAALTDEQMNSMLAPKPAKGDIQALVQKHATAQGLDPDIAARLVHAESAGNPKAVSPKGAMGLTQLMPGTARDLGVLNPFDPEQNLRGGFTHFARLMKKYNDPASAAAAYNMGEKGFEDYRAGKRGLPQETQDYIKKVTGQSPLWVDVNKRFPGHADTIKAVREYAENVPEANSISELFTKTVPHEAAQLGMEALEAIRPGEGNIVDRISQFIQKPAAEREVSEKAAINSALNNISTMIGLKGFDEASKSWSTQPLHNLMMVSGAKDILPDIAKGGVAIGENTVGRVAKPTIGGLTGRGTASVEEAIKSGESTGVGLNPVKSVTDFDKALRGQITGQDVVQNAHSALKIVKDKRQAEYLAKLQQVQANPSALNQVRAGVDAEVAQLSANYRIGINQTPQGSVVVDLSHSVLRAEAPRLTKAALTDVMSWTDNSATGLDTLKRILGDYVDQAKGGSPQEAMLTRLRNSVSDGLKANVPQYAEMTKGYAEATALIKDIEQGLTLKKTGMNGRVTADQTLRRLTSAMKDNFELRRDLVEALGTESGKDLAGQIAGHAMSPLLPQGLEGKGLLGIGVLMGHFINPHYWPLFAASSPRIMGEFLRMYGKGSAEIKNMKGNVGAGVAKGFVATRNDTKSPEPPPKWKEIGD